LLAANAGAEPATSPDTAPISLAAFFSNPTISYPTLSPDGGNIAFVFSQNDSQRVFVRSVGGSKSHGLVEFPMAEVRLTSLDWANSTRLVIEGLATDPAAKGVEPPIARLYSVNRERPRLKGLSEGWPRRGPAWKAMQVRYPDRIISLLPGDRDNVLVSHLEFGGRTPSVGGLNVYSGRLRLRHGATLGIDTWHVDSSGDVRAAEMLDRSQDGTGYTLLARSHVDQELVPVLVSKNTGDSSDTDTDTGTDTHTGATHYRFAGFADAPYLLYVIADHEGRDALYTLDIDNQKLGDLVFAHPEVDVTGAYYSEVRGQIVGATLTTDAPEIAFFDAAAKKEQRTIDRSFESVHASKTTNRVISATSDGALTIIEVASPVQPPVYYAYDRSKKEISFIFEQRVGLRVDRLAEVKRIDFAARDKVMIPGYLTLPRNLQPSKLPMIVLPHDGPKSRDTMVYDPVVQLFASRGYAVLQVNYRGSSGYGRAFRQAGGADAGRVVQQDIADGVRWVIQQGIADPDRIGVFGKGYGGHAALMGLATEPKLYAAGASFSGITNPANFTQHVRVPVLLGHGAQDLRLGVDRARDLAHLLEAAGTKVTYLEYEAESDDFVLESNRIDFYTKLLRFFDNNLAVGATQEHRQEPHESAPAAAN
jgi:dipeptidyl aminopeptidase/acylaminoacyl peptidase